jgi:hypothetical protein
MAMAALPFRRHGHAVEPRSVVQVRRRRRRQGAGGLERQRCSGAPTSHVPLRPHRSLHLRSLIIIIFYNGHVEFEETHMLSQSLLPYLKF